MMFFTLWPNKGAFDSYAAGIDHLRQHPAVCAEIRQLVELGVSQTMHVPASLGEGLQDVPLLSHSHYRREEILAGLDWASWERSARGNITGVAWAEGAQTDALLINLRKSESDFSPTTMYRDYALSSTLFHWESQNATSSDSPAGQRYIAHESGGSHVTLFVRDAPQGDLGAAAFLCLGAATYVEHTGDRPMAITWRLHRPMPAEAFQRASVVAG